MEFDDTDLSKCNWPSSDTLRGDYAEAYQVTDHYFKNCIASVYTQTIRPGLWTEQDYQYMKKQALKDLIL